MKETLKIKKWQLTRFRSHDVEADLSHAECVSIGKRAMRGGEMERAVMPQGITAIKAEAMRECRRLQTVELPAGKSIGISVGAFHSCTRLREVENCEGVVSIGANAFEGCVLLGKAPFGNSLRRVGDAAFRGCVSLEELALPASVEQIGVGAFRDCTELTCVEWNDSMAATGEEMFRGCLSLSEIRVPTAWGQIPRGAFRDCTALRAVEIPKNATRIENNAFRGCRRLENVGLELGIVRIGARAFEDTPALREVFIPHSLKSLGRGAFGLGKRAPEDRVRLTVENEYMARRLRRLLFFCGSSRAARVEVIGKSIEERKRERRRSTLDATPTHLADFE